ncbi:MAG: succinoglycan biosynthesis transport protein ExoP [Gammaproteobacteria bacterium]|jgi:succinoglycan biosynthesis transport protein ExoP
MEEKTFSLVDFMSAFKRRLRLFMGVSLAILAVGVTLVLILPSIYKSQAVILIERQEIPTDLVRSTVTSFAGQRIQTISQRVLSSANLYGIVEKYELYEEDRKNYPREVIVENMRENISLDMISAEVVDPKSGRPTEATIAFSLAFENESAPKSQRVANEILTLFLNENIKSRTDSAAETTLFLDDEAATLREHVAGLEEEIAKFKDENANARPELEALTRNLMDRTELELSEVDRRSHEASEISIYLEAELLQIEPTLPDAGPRGSSALDQLRSAEAQLSAAEATYGETHPDVIRLRKQADGLRATVDPNAARKLYEEQIPPARTKLNDLLERYGDTHPDVAKAERNLRNLERKLSVLPPDVAEAPNNPAYLGLATRLEATKAQLNSLVIKRRQLVEKFDSFTENLMLIPDAEAKFRALNRDYETALVKYREISAKQMEARLSQNLESERKGEKFTLIEPPLLPERPAKPNRPAILIIALVFSFLGGLGAVGLAETLDDKVRGRRDLQELLSAPPLATIPVIMASTDEARSFRRYVVPLLALVLVLVLISLGIHYLVMPLDVAFYSVMRRVGM